MCITNSLELEAVLQPGDTMRARSGADCNNQLVVREVDVLLLSIVFNFDLNQVCSNVKVDSLACNEVTPKASEEFANGLDKRAD